MLWLELQHNFFSITTFTNLHHTRYVAAATNIFFRELPKIENPVDAVWFTHNAKVFMILLVFRYEL
jgi:hypothetical protein